MRAQLAGKMALITGIFFLLLVPAPASIRPYKVRGPVTLQIEYTTRNSLSPDAGLAPGAEVLDDRTIRYRGKDFLEAYTRYRVP